LMPFQNCAILFFLNRFSFSSCSTAAACSAISSLSCVSAVVSSSLSTSPAGGGARFRALPLPPGVVWSSPKSKEYLRVKRRVRYARSV
jgi:hypothetical protein